MFTLNPGRAVHLHREAIDFRKAINGLAALVEHELGSDPFAAAVYVFTNRRRDRIKLLGWRTPCARRLKHCKPNVMHCARIAKHCIHNEMHCKPNVMP